MKGKTGLVCLCTLVFLLMLVLEACALPPKPHPKRHKKAIIHKHRPYVPAPHRVKPPAPSKRHLWVQRYRHPSGVYIGGFWRPPHKTGYAWTDGYLNEDGVWVSGFWKPLKAKKGHVWVPGYWESTIWGDGYWRLAIKTGFAWTPGSYNSSGIWIKGCWK